MKGIIYTFLKKALYLQLHQYSASSILTKQIRVEYEESRMGYRQWSTIVQKQGHHPWPYRMIRWTNLESSHISYGDIKFGRKFSNHCVWGTEGESLAFDKEKSNYIYKDCGKVFCKI